MNKDMEDLASAAQEAHETLREERTAEELRAKTASLIRECGAARAALERARADRSGSAETVFDAAQRFRKLEAELGTAIDREISFYAKKATGSTTEGTT